MEKPKQEVGKSNSHIRLSKKMVMRPARTVVTRLEKKTTQEVKIISTGCTVEGGRLRHDYQHHSRQW